MIVNCPKCRTRYEADVHLKHIRQKAKREGVSISEKVVCPVCEQWVRLPENEPCPAPGLPPELVQEMKSQSRVIDDFVPDEKVVQDVKITAACPKCDAQIRAPQKMAGRKVRCPRCRAEIQIPAAQSADEEFADWADSETWEHPSDRARRRGPAQTSGFDWRQVVKHPAWSIVLRWWMVVLGAALVTLAYFWPSFLVLVFVGVGASILGLVILANVIGLWIKSFEHDLSTEMFFIPWFVWAICVGGYLGYIALLVGFPAWRIALLLIASIIAYGLGWLVFLTPFCSVWVSKKKRDRLQPYLSISFRARVAGLCCAGALYLLLGAPGWAPMNLKKNLAVRDAAAEQEVPPLAPWAERPKLDARIPPAGFPDDFGRFPHQFPGADFPRRPRADIVRPAPAVPNVAPNNRQAPEDRKPVNNFEAKYAPGERVRVTWLGKTFSAEVVEQISGSFVRVQPLKTETDVPKAGQDSLGRLTVPLSVIEGGNAKKTGDSSKNSDKTPKQPVDQKP